MHPLFRKNLPPIKWTPFLQKAPDERRAFINEAAGANRGGHRWSSKKDFLGCAGTLGEIFFPAPSSGKHLTFKGRDFLVQGFTD